MTESILSILNPVHEPTVSEWMEIAKIKFENTTKHLYKDDFTMQGLIEKAIAIELMQRWEELTRGKWVFDEMPNAESKVDTDSGSFSLVKKFQPALLTKEMFVNSVEKPTDMYMGEQYYGAASDEYQAAQEKVLFEGFEIEHHYVRMSNVKSPIQFYPNDSTLLISGYRIYDVLVKKATLSDFITEISRYNRTATKPIEIKWTPNVIKKLLA